MILPRVVVLTWLILWVITVPLFHVHVPDVIKGPVSLFGGLPHTVFSPDLPGEYPQFLPSRDHPSGALDVSQHSLNYPELGFVVLNNTLKSLSKAHSAGQPAAFNSAASKTPAIYSRSASALCDDSRPVLYERPPPARAPPISSFYRRLLMS